MFYRYDAEKGDLQPIGGEDMKKDYFGLYDPTSAGHMGYNWRQTFWHAQENAIYGVHGNSGYLFRLDLRGPRMEVLERLTSLPSKRSGMFDQFSYGYLGFGAGAGRADDSLPDRADPSTKTADASRAKTARPWARPRGWKICT